MNPEYSSYSFIKKALCEDNGNPSSMRLDIFIAILALVPAVAFTLVYVVITQHDLIVATLGAVLTFLASLFGIKAWQKKNEAEEPKQPETPAP